MKIIRTYIAGNIVEKGQDGHDWRFELAEELEKRSGFKIVVLDPSAYHDGFDFDDNNERLVFGRDCFMIRKADLVVVNLTDDVGIGSSQEMLIAKFFGKPLVAFAKKGGRFNMHEKKVMGKVFRDWKHPFVKMTADKVAEDIDEAAGFVKDFFTNGRKAKDMSIIKDAMEYYEKDFHHLDKTLH